MQRLLILIILSTFLKSYFICYGGYLLYLEFEREVPTVHVGNRRLWLVILVYDVIISFVMGVTEDSEGVG